MEDTSPQESEYRASEKLRLLKSPLTSTTEETFGSINEEDAPNLSQFGDRYFDDCPQFQKHEDATLLELFYDLFFAANYTVFSQTQGVNSHARFKAYVGYFCILWMTWLSVALYDVRFVTDSIFERAARGVQLGVLVGLVVVAPNFTPDDQNVQTMRTLSLILAISRFCLAVEYGSILWHIRAFRRQRLPIYLQIGLNLVVSLIFLGITFRFRQGNSHVFVAWYIVSCIEVVATFALSILCPVLSFKGTHLMKRMTVLTVMILGDGVVIIAQNVVTIVKSPDAWDSQTIGIVTAAATTVYFVFLTYFDWMKSPQLPEVRQAIWTCLHFPLHIALVLFMQGFTQFIIWSKIIDVINHLSFNSIFNDTSKLARATTDQITKNLGDIIDTFFKTYPPQYADAWTSVDQGLTNISVISDGYWAQLAQYSETGNDADLPPDNETSILEQALVTIFSTMENALLETFGIDLIKELQDGTDEEKSSLESNDMEANVNAGAWKRFDLVFCYAYIATGVTLILMVVLTIVSRRNKWSRWGIIRTSLLILIGIATALVSLLYLNPTEAARFQGSPWLLPVICIIWTIVLVLTHIRNPNLAVFNPGRKS
ncbi:hypothetical protein ACJ41O_012508 [Fusarium nematophilum]